MGHVLTAGIALHRDNFFAFHAHVGDKRLSARAINHSAAFDEQIRHDVLLRGCEPRCWVCREAQMKITVLAAYPRP